MDVVSRGPWQARSLLWQPRRDAWAITVACHVMFELAPGESPMVAAPLDPIGGEDERRFVEPWAPVAPVKHRPEVVLVGHAYAPEARLVVGSIDKVLQVQGPVGWARQETDELTGSERLVLENLHPRFARIVTDLRAQSPVAVVSSDGPPQSEPLACDTLVIDSDRGIALLVWRGVFPLDHPQREGLILICSGVEDSESSTGTIDDRGVPRVDRVLPFHARRITLTGAARGRRPTLPFKLPSQPPPAPEEEPSDEEPPTLRRPGETPPPPPLFVPAPPPPPPPLFVPVPEPARETAPSIEPPAPAEPPPPPPPPPREPRPAPVMQPASEDTLELYAAISARRDRRPDDIGALLDAEGLTFREWNARCARWRGRIDGELSRGKNKLLAAYDAAYVAVLEQARGPITAGEYARIATAAERGSSAAVLAELGLPEQAMMHVRRVWLARMVKDPKLSLEVRAAMREVD